MGNLEYCSQNAQYCKISSLQVKKMFLNCWLRFHFVIFLKRKDTRYMQKITDPDLERRRIWIQNNDIRLKKYPVVEAFLLIILVNNLIVTRYPVFINMNGNTFNVWSFKISPSRKLVT